MAKRSQKQPVGEIMPGLKATPAISLDMSKAPTVNPSNIAPVYSNNAAVMMGAHDLRLIFSEIVMSGAAQTIPTIELRANVTMSPTQFKAFAQAIAVTLTTFENQFGEIVWPRKNQ